MVNLLPEKTRRSLTITYYARLLSAALALFALALFASAALLVPSFLRASAEADAATGYLAASQKATDKGAQGGASGQLALFSERIAILKSYPRPPVVARILSQLSAQVPAGVGLSKIVVTPKETGSGTVVISGKAATRSALLSLVNALQGVPIFEGVSVPVSALATDVNVPFSLSFRFTIPNP